MELDKYRAFRHYFVHTYSMFIDPEQLMPLLESVESVVQRFFEEIEHGDS